MQSLNGAYWRQRKVVLLAAGLCGFAFVVYMMRMPAHNRGFILVLSLMFALICSPFTLKTAAGRLWWGSFGTMLVSGAAAILLSVNNPLSWFFAVAAACAYAIGVCLRWDLILKRGSNIV
jgi:hypothetical protein